MRSLMLAGVVAWLVAAGLLAPSASAQQYPLQHFGIEEGLPQTQVASMVEDRRGYLWVGMRAGGVVRFDGQRFARLDTQTELVDSHVTDLLRDRKGRVWVATRGGVSRHPGGGLDSLTSFGQNDGLPHGWVRALAETPDGTVWAGTDGGLARYTDGAFSAVPLPDSTQVLALHADSAGRLWIGSGKGLFRYDRQHDKQGVVRVADADDLPAPTIHALHTDATGTLWIGTEEGAFRKAGARFERVEATRGMAVKDFTTTPGGVTWIATYASGLIRVQGDSSTRLTTKNGLNTNAILGLYADRLGNLWIGSQLGLSRLGEIPFRLYTQGQGLPNRLVWNIEGTQNGLWLASQEGVSRFSRGTFTAYGEKDGLPPGTIYGLAEGRDGRIWIGSRSGQLLHFNGSRFERVAPARRQDMPGILHIERDADTLWLATFGGTWRYDSEHGARPDTTLPQATTLDIHRDHAGRLWVATAEGLRARHADGRPLALPDTLRSSVFMSIAEGEAGHLWFSSPRGKLAFYAPETSEQAGRSQQAGRLDWISQADGMHEDTIWFLLFDEAGHLWMGHNTGVSRLDVPRYLRTGETDFETYSGSEYVGGETVQNAAYRDAEGRLWFAGNDGLVQYDPAQRPPARPPLRTHFTGIQPLYSEADVSQWADSTNAATGLPAGLHLPPGQNHLAFQFAGIDLADPRGVRYQYRMEGLNDAWSSPSAQQEANFTNLAPGAYTLLVRARSGGSDWGTPATYRFAVLPPFWQTWWFALAAAGGLTLLLFGFIRLRERSLRQQHEHLEKKVVQRTHELRSEKERAERFNDELALANLELEKLSLVARETDNAVVIADADGRIEWVNDAFTQLTTYTLDELCKARGPMLVEAVGPEHLSNIEDLVDTAVAEQRSVTYEWSFQTRRGDRRHLFSTLTPVFDEHGALHKLVVVEVDVTEQKRLEHKLIEAREEAVEAAQAKSAFLANMSHEIRTPMNGVIGMTSLLTDTSLSEEQREFVNVIRTSGETLLSIINDILDFSKIEAGKIELEEQPFAVHEAVEDALDLVRTAASKKDLELAYYIDPSVPAALRGDVTRLRQILTNLLSNAVKFTEVGKVSVHLDARPATDATGDGAAGGGAAPGGPFDVHVAVQDTGIGIPEDRREKLFHSFSQVDASTTRKYGGTGLGLAISRRLTQLMGGRMGVESEVGEGSTFRFSIRAEAAPPVSGSERLFEEQAALQGRHVLIVDDNETNRRMMRLQMERWGLEPHLASSGPEALRLADQAAAGGQPFEAAILDMQMPEMDGLKLARRLAERHPGIARLMLSSAGQRPAARSREAAPLDAWLSKPARATHLLRTLTSVLAKNLEPAAPVPAGLALEHDMGERHPLRILLAEDNAVNQKVALHMLERLGYRADVAANGREVLKALERQHYDLVLMDVQMPEMDGLEAARHIREQYDDAERPCLVAVTANATEEGHAACRQAGLPHVLVKPFSAKALADVLERCEPHAAHAPHDGSGPAQSPSPSRTADFRQEQVHDLIGDDPAFMHELLDTFLEDAPKHLRAMQAACDPADAEALEHAAHALKASSATFGADRLAALCHTLEAHGQEDRIDDRTATLVAEAADAFARARAAIAAHRQEA